VHLAAAAAAHKSKIISDSGECRGHARSILRWAWPPLVLGQTDAGRDSGGSSETDTTEGNATDGGSAALALSHRTEPSFAFSAQRGGGELLRRRATEREKAGRGAASVIQPQMEPPGSGQTPPPSTHGHRRFRPGV